MRNHFKASCNGFKRSLHCGRGKPCKNEVSKGRPLGSRVYTVAGERRSASRTEWSRKQEEPFAVPQALQATSNGNALQAVSALAYHRHPGLIKLHPHRAFYGNMTCMLLQVWNASSELALDFWDIDLMVSQNLRRVQNAMRNARLGPHHFAGSTGYGHGDLGRSALDEVLQPYSAYASFKIVSIS